MLIAVLIQGDCVGQLNPGIWEYGKELRVYLFKAPVSFQKLIFVALLRHMEGVWMYK
tara:strand:+ start:452 stop:622 length:171 start_codon:yes stop_codon:yes gene_type:complete